MKLDDRAADRQADSQACGLAGKKSSEQVCEIIRTQSLTGIANHNEHAVRAVVCGRDYQLALASVRLCHSLNCVEDQIEKHLLQLDAISWYRPWVTREVSSDQDAIS